MPPNAASVILEGQPIGEVERRSNGTLRLRYHDPYSTDPAATQLSVSMPPTQEVHGDTRITPWMRGLLPDNADVLARWGRDFSVSVVSLSTRKSCSCCVSCNSVTWQPTTLAAGREL